MRAIFPMNQDARETRVKQDQIQGVGAPRGKIPIRSFPLNLRHLRNLRLETKSIHRFSTGFGSDMLQAIRFGVPKVVSKTRTESMSGQNA